MSARQPGVPLTPGARLVLHNERVIQFFRYIWALPTTLIGIVLALASLRRGHVAIVEGVIEAHGPFLRRALALTPLAGGADAMTLGHVVIARDRHALEVTRAHERVHVRQYELWGPFFAPAYLLAGVYAFVRGGHPYFDNRFEREAMARNWSGAVGSLPHRGLPGQ